MGCLPCTQLNPEVAAVNDCYPRSKELVQAGPEFMPLSQDVSKLTYYATNKPSALAKIGEELEKRIVKEAKGSTGGYPKSRASLLISLVVLYKLLNECKRDIGLFARSAMRMISAALDVKVYQKNETDLEVTERASRCFVAFATYTDGNGIGVDDALTNAYLNNLSKFAQLSTYTQAAEKQDIEEQSRTRLVGLSALAGAAGSDAVFSSGVEFPRQVRIIIPALLSILGEAPVPLLKELVSNLPAKQKGLPSYFNGFTARRPINDRRAPSLHEHVPGQNGPNNEDVYSAAYRCLHSLASECQLSQASHVIDVVFGFLDRIGWQDVERCCWMADRLTAAMLLQSRFVVPTRLVELLVNMPDDVPPTAKHSSALAMITTVLSSSTSLVGLAVTDILTSLISVIVRRAGVSQNDALLPALVNCVSSLGTHIYYADQINDIVEEIQSQMNDIPTAFPARQECLRILIHCIMGVMTAADVGDEAETVARAASPAMDKDKGKGPQLDSPAVEIPRRDLGRRNPVLPEVWQETVHLLCEATFPVRAAYARALLFYLQTEMPRDRKPRPDEPNIVRFCNAINAAVYTLAMSSRLGTGEPLPSMPPSRAHSRRGSPRTANGAGSPGQVSPAPAPAVVFTVSEPTPADTPVGSVNAPGPPKPNGVTSVAANGSTTPGSPSSGVATPPRKPMRSGRRVSLPLNKLTSTTDLTSFDNVATPFDYSAILRILEELHAAVPVAALLTGAPMLLALDHDAGVELIRRPGDGRTGAWVLERKRACREVVAIVWRRISVKWGVNSVVNLADAALNRLPEPFVVPEWQSAPPTNEVIPPPEVPTAFYRDETEGESLSASLPLLDPQVIVQGYADAPLVINGSQRDPQAVSRRFTSKWSVEIATRDSMERYQSVSPAPESAVHPGLMAIPNASYQSFGRPVSRAVDVTDLREALAGSSSDGGLAGSAAQSFASTSISTVPAAASPEGKRPKPNAQEVLNDIFKDKKRAPRTSQPTAA